MHWNLWKITYVRQTDEKKEKRKNKYRKPTREIHIRHTQIGILFFFFWCPLSVRNECASKLNYLQYTYYSDNIDSIHLFLSISSGFGNVFFVPFIWAVCCFWCYYLCVFFSCLIHGYCTRIGNGTIIQTVFTQQFVKSVSDCASQMEQRFNSSNTQRSTSDVRSTRTIEGKPQLIKKLKTDPSIKSNMKRRKRERETKSAKKDNRPVKKWWAVHCIQVRKSFIAIITTVKVMFSFRFSLLLPFRNITMKMTIKQGLEQINKKISIVSVLLCMNQ